MKILKNGYKQEEKILEMINKQDGMHLLDPSPTLQRLESYGFIFRQGKRYGLSEKGRHARQLGIKNYLECERIEREILRYSLDKAKKRGRLIWASFLLFILVFFIFAFINFELFFEDVF